MDAHQIAQRLSGQAESVASHLLPAGKRQGREWCVGSISGEPGESLKVCVAGTKAGVWSDFAIGESGDLIELWWRVRAISRAEAIKEARRYLGISDERKQPQRAKSFQKPARSHAVSKPTNAVLDYLHSRALTEKSITAYRVGETPGGWISFPFMRDGELIYLKHLHITRDESGKKHIKAEPGCEPILFGMQVVPENKSFVVITEGELDALSLYEYGIPAVSVPNGAGNGAKNSWIDHCWEWLESFSEIFLCMDNDEPGQKAAADIANRLGLHRCKVVTLPGKDANECLTSGVFREDIFRCVKDARTLDPEELRSAGHYANLVVERFYPTEGKRPGIDLPWDKTRRLRLFDGEVSIWTGINGHGKSLLLGQIMLGVARQGHACCIASMEMSPEKTLGRMVQQELGTSEPTKQAIRDTLNRLNKDIWLFDLQGTAKRDRLLEVFVYAHKRYGVRQFVIDSLAKVGMGEDDYNGQKGFIDALGDFAKQTGGHVHLVAHARKGGDELTPPGKMDVKGTGALTDMVDNVLCVYRNKKKERELAILESGGTIPGRTIDKVTQDYDAYLICDKHREDGSDAEGMYGLYFNRKAQLFVERQINEF